MFGICPDKLALVARLKSLDVTMFSKHECTTIKAAITYIAIECVIRPRSELTPRLRQMLPLSDKALVKALAGFNLKVSAMDRLRVMREHVKHMDGYYLPSTKVLNEMYNDLNIPNYPFEDINQIPTEKQRAILITSGIAEQDINYDPANVMGPDDVHPSIIIALNVIDTIYYESKPDDHRLRNALKKAKHRVLVSGILNPNKAIPGYFFRNLRVKKMTEMIKAAEGYANHANGHDVAKVMAIHVAMAAGYTTPTARTHSTAALQTLQYDVKDFVDNVYPLTSLSKIPTQEQLDWQVKYGYAQKIQNRTPNVLTGVKDKLDNNVRNFERKM